MCAVLLRIGLNREWAVARTAGNVGPLFRIEGVETAVDDRRLEDLQLFARLCHAAVGLHGMDMPKVEQHVREAIALLPEMMQRSMGESLSVFLAAQGELGSALARRSLN
jgi:hypothetical protein